MIHVSISEEIAKACPDLHVAVVECDVVNTVSDEQLWNEITEVETHIRTTCKLEDINKFPPIQATRQGQQSAACRDYPNTTALHGFCATMWDRIPPTQRSRQAALKRLERWLERVRRFGLIPEAAP